MTLTMESSSRGRVLDEWRTVCPLLSLLVADRAAVGGLSEAVGAGGLGLLSRRVRRGVTEKPGRLKEAG